MVVAFTSNYAISAYHY